ncbi:MAG: HEAT repeat domain-containing protein [Planctomycetota bacterium]|jgi:HEAT repeat protein
MNRKVRHVIAFAILCAAVAGSTGARAAEEEARLIQTLEGDGSWAEKDKACRRLQVIGTRSAIPALAALLSDEKLSHIARCALEAMPYPESGRALRAALGKTSGKALVGVVTSLGFRRDKQAVPQLARMLAGRDAEVVGAAAAALGRTGTPEAARALKAFRARASGPQLSVAAEASLTAAEQLLSQGRQVDAAEMYEELLRPKWPVHARLGAFAGILKARPREAVARVIEAVAGKDPALRAVAIANISALSAPGAAERFAAELPKLAADVQAMLIGALAECGDAAVGPAIVSAASSRHGEVRIAAAEALGKIGDASSVKVLCRLVAEGGNDAEKRAAAKSLRSLRGDGVDAALADCMTAAPQDARPELIEALVARDAKSAVRALFVQTSAGDKGTRAAAFKALGWLAGPEDLPRLLQLLVGLEGDGGRKEAELAAVRVSRKITDDASRGDAALRAFRAATAASAKHSLLRVLAGIGDARALEVVRAALADRDAGVRDAAVRALSDWADPRAVDALLDVYRTTESEIHRVLVLRGCVRLLSLGKRSTEDTLSVYGELVRLGRRTDEKKLVLAGLAKVADPGARAVVEPLLSDAAVKAEAEAALLGIARGIMASAPNEARSIAEKLRAGSESGVVRRGADAILRQVDKFKDYIVAWQVTGVYGEGRSLGALLRAEFPPEEADAKDVAWYMLPISTKGDTPWMFDLLGALGGERRAAYVRTWVNSARDQRARLEFGIDDGSKVWLNGKVVHADGRGGAATPGEHKVKVRLREGWNALVMKITQDTGPWQFCLRVRAPDGGELEGLRADATREAAIAGPIKAAAAAAPGKATASARGAAPVRTVPKGDWIPVFNGRDLAGWKATGNAVFKVEEGRLVGTQTTGKGGDLWTEAQWDDFELRATYRVEWPANSGLWFRHDGRKGYQFDILKYKRPVAFSGTLYCPGKMFITKNLNEALENRDGWNEARIRAAADEITLWLNGTEVGKCRDKTLSKGKIGIQVHAGNGFKGMKIVFKNIDIRALTVQGR